MEWPADNSYRAVRDWLIGFTTEDNRESEAIVRTLLEWQTGKSRATLLSGDHRFTESALNRLKEAALRLQKGTPVQHVTGEAWFYGRRFQVGPQVLIPRPETEELIALLLPKLNGRKRLLDVGTGSGCIAVTFALEAPFLLVDGWDVSVEALALAQSNASTLGASVHFKHQDVFTAEVVLPFDVLVSNPPYIGLEEADSLETKVREHEPALALFVNEHPLEFYRFMVAKFPAWLSPDGIFGFECHSRYADDVLQLCRAAGCQELELHTDAQGLARMVIGRRQP